MSVASAMDDCTKHMGTNLDCIVVGASSGAGFCLLPSDKDYCTGYLCIKLECVPSGAFVRNHQINASASNTASWLVRLT